MELIRTDALIGEVPIPDWVQGCLARAPLVVVRRTTCAATGCPLACAVPLAASVAAWLPSEAVACASARTIWRAGARGERPRRRNLPHFAALDRIQALMDTFGLAWGPTGSGFELASRTPSVTTASDLDLVLRALAELPRETARSLGAAWPQCRSRLTHKWRHRPGAWRSPNMPPVQPGLAATLGRRETGGESVEIGNQRGRGIMSIAFLCPGQVAQTPGFLHRLPDQERVAAHAGGGQSRARAGCVRAGSRGGTRVHGCCAARHGHRGCCHGACHRHPRRRAAGGRRIIGGGIHRSGHFRRIPVRDAIPLIRLRGTLMERAYPQGGSSVFTCKTSQIGPSGPWPSGG